MLTIHLAPLLLTFVGSLQGTEPRCDPLLLTLHPDQPSYAPGEEVCVHVQGLPNTLTLLGIDVDPGPTMLPFGTLQLGLTPSFFALAGRTGDQGCFEWCCTHDCGDPALGVRFYLQAVQILGSGTPLFSNGASVIWEDLTGVCEPQDLCLGGGVKPQVLTMRYTGEGCSASSHAQEPGSVLCSGDPAFAPMVHVVARDPSSKHLWFEGDLALGGTFEADATMAGETRLKGDTVLEVYDASSAALLQSVQLHTSCSQPLRVGDRFGGFELLGVVLE